MIKTNLTSSIGKEPEHLPPRIIVGKIRRDGKYPVTYIYPGAVNMFGGRDYPRSYKKLHTAEQILEHDLDHYDLTDNSQGTFPLEARGLL